MNGFHLSAFMEILGLNQSSLLCREQADIFYDAAEVFMDTIESSEQGDGDNGRTSIDKSPRANQRASEWTSVQRSPAAKQRPNIQVRCPTTPFTFLLAP